LHQQALGEGIVLLEPRQQRVALAFIPDLPHPGARGAEGRLDEEGKVSHGGKFAGRADHRGFGLRHLKSRQELGETGLALHLFEGLEIGERDAETDGKSWTRGGEQIGLLMHRQQDVDRARLDDIQHRGEIVVGIGARRRHWVHAFDKTREAPEAERLA
jgi:hypothetical protein